MAWENEAYLAVKELGPDQFEIIVPSLSMFAEPPVAVVSKVADRHGALKVAQAYIDYLYSKEGQEIAGRNFYRPRDRQVADKFAGVFKDTQFVTVDQEFGGWKKAQAAHFADGASFDQIFVNQ